MQLAGCACGSVCAVGNCSKAAMLAVAVMHMSVQLCKVILCQPVALARRTKQEASTCWGRKQEAAGMFAISVSATYRRKLSSFLAARAGFSHPVICKYQHLEQEPQQLLQRGSACLCSESSKMLRHLSQFHWNKVATPLV